MSIVTASNKTANLGKMMEEEISSDNAMMMMKLKNSGIILRKLDSEPTASSLPKVGH